MATEKVLTAIDVADNSVDNSVKVQTTQLPLREVKSVLNMWFKGLKWPSDPSQTTPSDQNRNPSAEDQKLLERLLKVKETLSPEDIEQLERLKENLSQKDQKLLERLLKVKEALSAEDTEQLEQLKENLSQKDQKLLERLEGKGALSPEDQKLLKQLKENLSPENRKLIERLLKVKEHPSPEDQKLIERLLKVKEHPSPEQSLKHLQGVQKYFVLLNEALTQINEDLVQIKESKSHPPHITTEYMKELEKLCSRNNPYGFVKTLEEAVDTILHLTNKINPKETFILYYFHRRKLQKDASDKWFSSYKQIGKVWD